MCRCRRPPCLLRVARFCGWTTTNQASPCLLPQLSVSLISLQSLFFLFLPSFLPSSPTVVVDNLYIHSSRQADNIHTRVFYTTTDQHSLFPVGQTLLSSFQSLSFFSFFGLCSNNSNDNHCVLSVVDETLPTFVPSPVKSLFFNKIEIKQQNTAYTNEHLFETAHLFP